VDPQRLLAALDVDVDGVLLRVRVQPNASSAGVVGPHGDTVKLRVTAPPEAGRANDAVVELIAATLGIRARDVALVRGDRSRVKVLRIAGLPVREVVERLAAEAG